MAKRGRLSNEEREYILSNAGEKTAEEMAKEIDRTPEMITEFIEKELGAKPSAQKAEISVRREFRESSEWKELKKQFSDEELLYFEEQYAGWMAQLKEDFVASEETQVILLIKTQILLNRNLAEKRMVQLELEQMEGMLDDIASGYSGVATMPDDVKDRFVKLEEQLTTVRSSQQSKTMEFVKLQEKHEALMKGLKATRDQRLKRIENLKVSFVDIIKEMMKEERRLDEGEQMELMRLAAVKESRHLGELHEFANGEVDRPLLTPEIIEAQ